MVVKITPTTPEEGDFARKVNEQLHGVRVIPYCMSDGERVTYHMLFQCGGKRTSIGGLSTPFCYDPIDDVVKAASAWAGGATAGDRWTTDLEAADGY